jgi:hypothetical protein
MTAWTPEELDRFELVDEVQIAPLRNDGTPRKPVPVWVVRDRDDVYVRSYRGPDGAWYRAARASGRGRISRAGVDSDVAFAEATDAEINDRIDAAYRAKYGRYGSAYIDPMLAARETTLRLVPR